MRGVNPALRKPWRKAERISTLFRRRRRREKSATWHEIARTDPAISFISFSPLPTLVARKASFHLTRPRR
jgi:hypothetical protein